MNTASNAPSPFQTAPHSPTHCQTWPASQSTALPSKLQELNRSDDPHPVESPPPLQTTPPDGTPVTTPLHKSVSHSTLNSLLATTFFATTWPRNPLDPHAHKAPESTCVDIPHICSSFAAHAAPRSQPFSPPRNPLT